MFVTLDYENILKHKSDYIFVDVRSPEEFEDATIPGAYNIPLFSNEERKNIGILYKKEGKEISTKLGIDLISNNLPRIYNDFLILSSEKKKIAVFCARGGMRSSSIGSLLNSLGIPIVKINYGYKGYRSFIVKELPKLVLKFIFVPLYGKTGTGKTDILYKIKETGYPTLDLEHCANHRGSLLGSIGLGKQNSQKTFESLIFDELYKLGSGYVFTEGESKRIGRVIMPNYLHHALLSGKKILVDASLKKRIKIIYETYIKENYSIFEMKEAIKKLSVYIGERQALEYIVALEKEDYKYVIEELMVKYYDNAYKIKNKEFELQIENETEEQAALDIIKYVYN